MKKIVFSIFIIITLIVSLNQITYAATEGSNNFFSEAVDATKKFLNEDPKDVPQGAEDAFSEAKKIIVTINRILTVALLGLSIVALSVVGIKFIIGGADAKSKAQAKNDLKTVMIGLAFGLGAYTIWSLGISIINLVIKNM